MLWAGFYWSKNGISYTIELESEHRGYNMKNAELFRTGQSKPEVLKETWVEQFPALAGFTVPG
jgi:hypothetical protein